MVIVKRCVSSAANGSGSKGFAYQKKRRDLQKRGLEKESGATEVWRLELRTGSSDHLSAVN
jgi:hypothetical protein